MRQYQQETGSLGPRDGGKYRRNDRLEGTSRWQNNPAHGSACCRAADGDYPYSVAEHSVLVERLFTAANPAAPVKWQLAALLHDAPEYVIGDMISPVKAAIGPGYGALDDRLTAAIHLRFGLPATIPVAVKKQIKAADKLSAWLEATQIAGFSVEESNRFFGAPKSQIPLPTTLTPRPPMQVKADFIARFEELCP